MTYSLTEILRLSSSKLLSFWSGLALDNVGRMEIPVQFSVLELWQISTTLSSQTRVLAEPWNFVYASNSCNLLLTLGQLHVLVSFRVISAHDVTRDLTLASILYLSPFHSDNCLPRLFCVVFSNKKDFCKILRWNLFVLVTLCFLHVLKFDKWGEDVSNKAEGVTHFIFGRIMVSFLFFEPVLVCLHVARARARCLVTFLCLDWQKRSFPPTFGGTF